MRVRHDSLRRMSACGGLGSHHEPFLADCRELPAFVDRSSAAQDRSQVLKVRAHRLQLKGQRSNNQHTPEAVLLYVVKQLSFAHIRHTCPSNTNAASLTEGPRSLAGDPDRSTKSDGLAFPKLTTYARGGGL